MTATSGGERGKCLGVDEQSQFRDAGLDIFHFGPGREMPVKIALTLADIRTWNRSDKASPGCTARLQEFPGGELNSGRFCVIIY